jgi:hypothetical protein
MQKAKHHSALIVSLLLLSAYFFIAYFLKRTDIYQIFALVAVVTGGYFFVVRKGAGYYSCFVALAFVLRLLFLCSTPALSDDFYRFIWDGSLIRDGINPFSYLPEKMMQSGLVSGAYYETLFQHMNSPQYYSVYPPVLQGLFFLSVKCAFGVPALTVLNMRLFIIASEVGTYIFLGRILKLLRINRERIFIYLFNPLIIIELCGNVHFEAVMIFFFSAAFYLLLCNRISLSAVFFALAVSTKVIPLILLPLIIRKIGIKKGAMFTVLVAGISVALFLPFVNKELLAHLADSFGLYFHQFEFNASVYYLLKWLECRWSGQETIRVTSIVLPILTVSIILYLSLRMKSRADWSGVPEKALAILSMYYVLSPVVHPWYITFLVMWSVFISSRYALVWSVLAFLSYAHYATFPYQEHAWLILAEYGVLGAAFFYEYYQARQLG